MADIENILDGSIDLGSWQRRSGWDALDNFAVVSNVVDAARDGDVGPKDSNAKCENQMSEKYS